MEKWSLTPTAAESGNWYDLFGSNRVVGINFQ